MLSVQVRESLEEILNKMGYRNENRIFAKYHWVGKNYSKEDLLLDLEKILEDLE